MILESPQPMNAATSSRPARCHALIPCAGVGARARAQGQPPLAKQYQVLAGQPVLAHTLAAFEAVDGLAGVAVVVAPDDTDLGRLLPELAARGVQRLRCGGANRAESVLQGLKAWLAMPQGPQPEDWVLVHDAARCLVTPAQIRALMRACQDDPVGGLLALPLPDTLKAEQGGRVAQTLARADKWLAQTPQMFRFGALRDALEQALQQGLAVTDEASALEARGLAPRLVAGSAQNFKITYPEDFSLAEAVLRARAAA